MTGEHLPQRQEEAAAYIPTFNLDQMSVEDVANLWAALDAVGRGPQADGVSIDPTENLREALISDLRHYPAGENYDRSLELFEMLSGSENEGVNYLGALAIGSLLHAA